MSNIEKKYELGKLVQQMIYSVIWDLKQTPPNYQLLTKEIKYIVYANVAGPADLFKELGETLTHCVTEAAEILTLEKILEDPFDFSKELKKIVLGDCTGWHIGDRSEEMNIVITYKVEDSD